MKSLWLACAVLACFAVAPRIVAQARSATKGSGTLEQKAITNEKALIEAKKKDDAAFFRRTLSEDFSLVGVDGKLLQNQEAADNLGDSGLVELKPYDIKVLALGDDGAIVSYDAIVREKPEEDQGPPPRYQHFSSVWLKQGDQWKLKFHQATAAHWGDW
ncbi:MAG TPA: nuclear transport factor 2 family protein [Candidatus Acidoferrales bacterium]|nr:nuclear transport factor 2 family protein [Candidatus Acidoferrales bacterium]